MESTSSRNRDRSCLNKLAPSAFVQALLIHVVLNTGRKLDLLFNEQPFIPLHSPCCIPIQSRVVLRSTGIKTHTIQSLRRWKSTDFQRKCCRGSLQRKPCNNFNSPQPTGKISLLSPDLQLYFGATRRKCPIQAATLTGKRVKRSRNMELVRALFRLLKNCVSACWYIKVTLSTSKQPVLKSYREKAEQKFSPETRVIHCYSIHINHCTLIFPTAQCS